MRLSFFFFKQKTAYEMRISDWSSDVCSSDLILARFGDGQIALVAPEIEDRQADRRAEAPRHAVVAEQIVERQRRKAEIAGQRDRREESGPGGAHVDRKSVV